MEWNGIGWYGMAWQGMGTVWDGHGHGIEQNRIEQGHMYQSSFGNVRKEGREVMCKCVTSDMIDLSLGLNNRGWNGNENGKGNRNRKGNRE